MFYSTPPFQQELHYGAMFTLRTRVCACSSMHAHVYCIQVAVFILVALLANVFPHLNTTPPILFISHICGRESKWYGTEERVSERQRGVCVRVSTCARTHTKSEWWELVPADDVTFFHPPLFVLLFLWPMYNKPPATVSYIVIYRHLQRSTRISWPHFHPITFLPLQN